MFSHRIPAVAPDGFVLNVVLRDVVANRRFISVGEKAVDKRTHDLLGRLGALASCLWARGWDSGGKLVAKK